MIAQKYFKDNWEQTVMFYVNTPGCYILRKDDILVLAYLTTEDCFDTIDYQGDCLFVQWFEGDWLSCVHYFPQEAVNKLIYYRDSRLKVVDIKRFHEKLRKSCEKVD